MEKNTISLILCAGKASRMQGIPKQILPIGAGEVFISRIVRQIRQRNGRPICVTKNAQIRQSSGAPGFDPGTTDYTVETLAATIHLWEQRTHILLGDVCYSQDCMNQIFAFDGSIAVWGDRWEIFGISFSIDQWQRVALAIDQVLLEQRAPALADLLYATTGQNPTPYIPRSDPGRGKLRRFYQAIAGLPFGDALEPKNAREILHYVRDYTQDVDTIEDYARFRLEILTGGQIDDQ